MSGLNLVIKERENKTRSSYQDSLMLENKSYENLACIVTKAASWLVESISRHVRNSVH